MFPGSEVGPGSAEVDDALREILARPEFLPYEPSLISRIFGRVGDWFWGILGDLLERIGLGTESMGWIGLVVLGAVFLALSIWIVRSIARTRRARKRSRARIEDALPSVDESPVDWDRRAAKAAAAGRWREAAHLLYHAVVHRLAKSGALHYDSAKTPGDYRRELRSAPKVEDSFRSFLSLFEPYAFGPLPADADGYAELRTVADRVGPRV